MAQSHPRGKNILDIWSRKGSTERLPPHWLPVNRDVATEGTEGVPQAFIGKAQEGGPRWGRGPSSVQPEAGALAPACLAEHLLPVEDSLPLLPHLQLPPLLGALHAPQHRVGAGASQRGRDGCRGASVLRWEEGRRR